MRYVIRTVRAEDWRELKELRLAALADPVSAVAFNEPYAKAVAQSDEFWRRRAAQGDRGESARTFIGAEPAGSTGESGRWAGMATVLVEQDSALVAGVYLRPEHRGTGLAGQLFAAAEEWASSLRAVGVRRMRLHVHEDNPRAEAFYRRLGYARTGETMADPKNPALVDHEMELPLHDEPARAADRVRAVDRARAADRARPGDAAVGERPPRDTPEL